MLTTITQNLKHTKPLFILILSLLTLFTFTGCKSPEATEIPSEPIASDPVSEVVSEEVSEVVSKPVSEEISEIVSEEVSEEIIEGIEYTNFSNFNEFEDYLKTLNRTAIVEFDFSEEDAQQAIIPNGEKYNMQMGNRLGIYPCKEVVDMQANVDYIKLMPPLEGDKDWTMIIQTTGTDVEVSFTVVYADGTEEDFTIYVTVSE